MHFLAQWKDIILLVVGFVLSIVGAVAGAWVQRKWDRRAEARPLNQLLNFGPDDLVFVFPHRQVEGMNRILPLTSTEDFMAMNNFISALLRLDRRVKIVARDTSRIKPEDKRRNLVLICSPKSNTVAAEMQREIDNSRERFTYRFEKNPKTEEWYIVDPDGDQHHSHSYEQERGYLNANVDLAGQEFDDLAILTKIRNPLNKKCIVVFVAGLRGIGTWGAAECIKKSWQQIYKLLPTDEKDIEFSVLLKVHYKNCDITETKVIGKLYTSRDAVWEHAKAHTSSG